MSFLEDKLYINDGKGNFSLSENKLPTDDPIFIPFKKKVTFGQMLKLKKMKMDHRYLAFKKLKKKIKI